MRLASVSLLGAAIALAGAAHGCGGEPTCATAPPADCAPLYEPTFDQIYTRTLHPTCAVSGASCHAAEGNQGGLAFTDADTAYALLLGQSGEARVAAGDTCSELMARLDATDPGELMPPGAQLSEAERCAVATWIRNGAKR